MRTEMKHFDYEILKSSNTYYSILKTNIANRQDQFFWYRKWFNNVEWIERLIDKELNNEF
jgi:hypothetical protein